MTSDSDRKLVIGLRNEAASWTNLTPRQDEMFRQAADRIEALERERQWRPIETAPTSEAVSFLVHAPERLGSDRVVLQVSRFQGDLYPDGLGAAVDWGDEVKNATHWLPLPQPPEGTDK